MAHILIVDDEALVRQALAQILKRLGHEVVQAEDGVQGLEAYEQAPPDAVIVDMIMPNMDGLEMISRLRQLDENARVICMSGGGGGDNYGPIAVLEAHGVRAILLKPFTVEQVMSAVDGVLS